MQEEIAPRGQLDAPGGHDAVLCQSPPSPASPAEVSPIEPGKGVTPSTPTARKTILRTAWFTPWACAPNTAPVEELCDVCPIHRRHRRLRPSPQARQAMEEGYWAAVNLA